MSEEEITEIVTNYIENGEKRNLGYLMGKFNVENNGKNFDNKLVSEIIKKNI
jgi:Glu-tRNA(Gln) amidotransferase subunit E-like FAD-binding protein